MNPAVFELGVPILGICYGCQLMAQMLGGKVTPAQEKSAREYGKTVTWYDPSSSIFHGLPEKGISWMSHGDYMARVPEGFRLATHSAACSHVAIANETRRFYGVQFHPEVSHTGYGTQMIRNFLYEVCGDSMAGMMPSVRARYSKALTASSSVTGTYSARPMSWRWACSGPMPW